MAVRHADVRAEPVEIGVEVITVVSEYFIGDRPAVVQDRVNEIWLEHLGGYPLWAIRNATAWWLGKGNPKRSQRPKPGDIAHRCDEEIAPLTAAKRAVEYWEKYRGDYPAHLVKNTG